MGKFEVWYDWSRFTSCEFLHPRISARNGRGRQYRLRGYLALSYSGKSEYSMNKQTNKQRQYRVPERAIRPFLPFLPQKDGAVSILPSDKQRFSRKLVKPPNPEHWHPMMPYTAHNFSLYLEIPRLECRTIALTPPVFHWLHESLLQLVA